MYNYQIHTVYSPAWILLCLAVGIGMAWFLYRKSGPWPTWLRWVLGSIRALLITLICFLLLEPYTRHIWQEELKPTVVLALDNSQSVQLFTPNQQLTSALNGLEEMAERLTDKGYQVERQSFTSADTALAQLTKVRFTAASTNLHELLYKSAQTYRNQNLKALVLISDGINNLGLTPTYQNYPAAIYPIALGDTIPKKDVVVEELQYNKINYSGTSFPLVARIRHYGYSGENVTVLLQERGQTIQRKSLRLPRSGSAEVTFQISSGQPAKKHYQVVVQPLAQEFTDLNNRRNAYLEVVKGKLKVLLAAAAPHPDVKALRSALLTNPLLDVEVVLGPFQNPSFKTPYDAAVLHQIPNVNATGAEWLRRLRAAKVPTLYVLGAQTDYNSFNALQAGVQLAQPSSQSDQVQPLLNASFQRFATEPLAPTRIKSWPPATVAFGEWKVNPSAEIILQQQVGSVRTSKPLLVFRPAQPSPSAVLLTDGSWQWRLTEAAEHENPRIYDELMTHVVQLLANRRNQKRLHVYSVKDEYEVSEEVTLQAEVFNAVQEEVFGQNIAVKITPESGKPTQHSFRHAQGGEGLKLGTLPAGVYRYAASASLENQTYRDSGEFVVQEQHLETLMAVANHNLMSQLAQRSETKLYQPNQLNQLEQDLLKADFKTILRSHEEEKDLMEQLWFYFLLLGLVITEWALRRYFGTL